MDWRALLLRPTSTTAIPTRHTIPTKSKQQLPSVRQSKDEVTDGYKNQKTLSSNSDSSQHVTATMTPPLLEYKPSNLFVQSAEDDASLSTPLPVTATTTSIQYPKSIALRIVRASRLLRIALRQCAQTLSRWTVDNASTITSTNHFAPDAFYKPSQAAERFQYQWLNTTMCLHEQDSNFWTQQFTHMYTFHYLLYRKWCRVQAHLQQSLIAPPSSSSSQSLSSLNRARQRQTLGEIETCLSQQEDHFYAKMWRYATCYDETDARRALGAKACVRKHGDDAMGHIQCWVAPSGSGTSDLIQTVYGEAFADTLDIVSLDFMSMPSLTLNSVDTLLRQVSQQWLSDHFCRRKVPITAANMTTTSNEDNDDDEALAAHFVRTRIVIVPQLDVLLEDRQKSNGGNNGSVTRHLDEATIDAIAHSIFRFLANPAWQHCQVPIVFWLTLHNQNAFRVRQLLRAIHHYTYVSSATANVDATTNDYDQQQQQQQQWQRQTRDAPLVHFHTPLAEGDAVALRREWLVRWMRCDLQRRRLEGWRQQAPPPPSLSSSSLSIDDSAAYWASLVVRQRWQHVMSLHYLLQWVDRVCDPVQWTHHQSDANAIQTTLTQLTNACCQSMAPTANTTSDVGSMSVWLQQLNWCCIDMLDTEREGESALVQVHSTVNHTPPTVELATTFSSSTPATTVFGLQWFCTAMAYILMPLTYECHLQLSAAATTTPSISIFTATKTMRKRPRHLSDTTNDDDNSMLPPNAKRACLASRNDDTTTTDDGDDCRVQLPSPLQHTSSLDPWRRALARLPFHQFVEQCRLNWTHLMLREETSSSSSSASLSSRPMTCTRRMRNQRTAMPMRDVRALAQRMGLYEIIRLNEVMALIYDLRNISYTQRYAGGDMWRAFQSNRDDNSSEAMAAIEDGDDALFGIALLNAFFRDAQLDVSTLQMRNSATFNHRQESHWQVTMTPEVQLAWVAKRVQWMRTPSSSSTGKKNMPTSSSSSVESKSSTQPPSLDAHWGGLTAEDWRALKQTSSRLPSMLNSLDAVHRTPDFLQQNAAMALAFEYL